MTGKTQMKTQDQTTNAKTMRDLEAQLKGYSLTTAEILYHLPDHPALLQSYIWQEYDQAPLFPRLRSFLDFWAHNLDGKLSRVLVSHRRLIQPREWRLVTGELKLH